MYHILLPTFSQSTDSTNVLKKLVPFNENMIQNVDTNIQIHAIQHKYNLDLH